MLVTYFESAAKCAILGYISIILILRRSILEHQTWK